MAESLDESQALSLEERLLRRAQQGDRRALRGLLERHSEPLFCRVILPRVGDRAAAEDILKATLVTAIEKLDTFQWRGRSIYFWLRQIAANKVIDHHRANQRSRKLAERLAREPQPQIAGKGPELSLIAAEERRINRRRIDQTLAQINPRYRRAIELRLLQDLSREECAADLEVSVSTFDVVLFRALTAFRKGFLADD